MAETYYFFDSAPVYQAEWSKSIGKALLDGVLCGVGDDLFVYGDASGMQVKVKSGACHIKGHYYFSDAEQVFPINAAPAVVGERRYALVVCEVDWANKNMSVKVIEGADGVSPALPALTRSATVWQIPLARITIVNGDTNVPAGSVADMRSWALGTFTLPLIIGSGQSLITTGPQPVGVLIPNRSKIVSWHMTADAVGSIVVDLWKDLYTAYPPTVADTICNTTYKPTLSSAQQAWASVWNEATYLNQYGANWLNTFEIADPSYDKIYLLANVDSIATVKMVNLTLTFARMIAPQS